ncbi:MAG: inner membrane CreD family protein, partial [Ferruginibacter sp.]
MNNNYPSLNITFRIWIICAIIFAMGVNIADYILEGDLDILVILFSFIATLVGSLPAVICLLIALPIIRRSSLSWNKKVSIFLLISFLLTLPYGIIGGLIQLLPYNFLGYVNRPGFLSNVITISGVLFICEAISAFLILKRIASYFSNEDMSNLSYQTIINQLFFNTTISKTKKNMETFQQPIPENQHSNRILIKGLITGGLILLMLIPTVFINNLINERELRQKEVVREVSSKWSSAQTLSGPFLVVPYTDTVLNSDGKAV